MKKNGSRHGWGSLLDDLVATASSLRAGHLTKGLTCAFIPQRYWCHYYFIDEETENQKNHINFPSRLSSYMTEPGFKCKLSSYLWAKPFHLTTKLLYCPPPTKHVAWPGDKCLVCPESHLGGLVVNAAAYPGPSLKQWLKYTVLVDGKWYLWKSC